MSSNTRYHTAAFISCFLLVWITYSGNGDHQLLHWDDISNITTNPWLTDPSWRGIVGMFTSFHLYAWQPVVWLSYIPDYYFCGDAASCYKATNLCLHVVNCFLIYYLCGLLVKAILIKTQPGQHLVFLTALISGLLFAVHGQHAESVIWITERKDLLSTLFFLLSVIFYVRMHTVKGSCKASIPFLFFCFAVFSKPMAVTLPIILLLMDVYPLRRLAHAGRARLMHVLLIEKSHYYITAFAIVLITLLSQDVIYIEQPSFIEKINTTIAALQHYLISFVYPFGLSPLYPIEVMHIVSPVRLYLFAAAFILLVVYLSLQKQAAILTVIAWFLITLLPVTGIVKFAAEHPYADRYTYLPMAGFYMLAGYVAAVAIIKSKKHRVIPIMLTLIALLGLAWNTHQYKDTWKTDFTLWEYVVDKYPDISSMAHQNLGNSYYELNDYNQAVIQYSNAIVLDRGNLSAYANLASAYNRLGEGEMAIDSLVTGVNNNPENPQAYLQAGDAYYNNGQYKRAFDYYLQSIEIEPDYPYGLLALGRLLVTIGDIRQSIQVLESIPADSPIEFEAQLLLARANSRDNMAIALTILDNLKMKYGNDPRIDRLKNELKGM